MTFGPAGAVNGRRGRFRHASIVTQNEFGISLAN